MQKVRVRIDKQSWIINEYDYTEPTMVTSVTLSKLPRSLRVILGQCPFRGGVLDTTDEDVAYYDSCVPGVDYSGSRYALHLYATHPGPSALIDAWRDVQEKVSTGIEAGLQRKAEFELNREKLNFKYNAAITAISDKVLLALESGSVFIRNQDGQMEQVKIPTKPEGLFNAI